MLEERDHAVILRTLAGGSMPTPRSTLDSILRPRALARARHRLDRRRDLRRQRRPRRGVRHRLGHGRLHRRQRGRCSPPASPARWPARSRWAPARTWRRNRSARSTSRKSPREQRGDRRGPARRTARARAVLPAERVLAPKSRARWRSGCRRSRNNSCARSSTKSSASCEETFPNPWRSTLSAGVSTAIGGFIPIIPFFFTVGMPAVIASFIISTLAHFVVGASKALVTTRSWWASGDRDDARRRPRSRDYLRPRPGVRRPLTSCHARLSTFAGHQPNSHLLTHYPAITSTEEPLALPLRFPLPAKRFAGGARCSRD